MITITRATSDTSLVRRLVLTFVSDPVMILFVQTAGSAAAAPAPPALMTALISIIKLATKRLAPLPTSLAERDNENTVKPSRLYKKRPRRLPVWDASRL